MEILFLPRGCIFPSLRGIFFVEEDVEANPCQFFFDILLSLYLQIIFTNQIIIEVILTNEMNSFNHYLIFLSLSTRHQPIGSTKFQLRHKASL